jgi:choline dehydrogenase-like flavoprotein
MHDIWEAAGAQDILTIDRYAHLIGGARMGFDPEHSVCDADHRV